MKSIILKAAAGFLLPLLLLFSFFLLLRGHYLPGGGFVGGLVASIAFILHAFAGGLKKGQKYFPFHPGFLMPMGLLIAFASALLPMLMGDGAFMTGLWYAHPLPVIGMLGTALFFDLGVYLLVVGVTLTIIFTIVEAA